ncbi:S1C family serine protease [Cellulomonas composti]|uniref:PDZ domain-containing protein n=1 Tax=Cellulomonas composti TaxID=266130 RepID=A0A511J9Z1_9CELL|nr:trypsin-like peptidase domain-containing protein [Cellulomonas composti]GEL94798.1 hypothetical protein CCO02nite_14560 [Cellulomonas composti]
MTEQTTHQPVETHRSSPRTLRLVVLGIAPAVALAVALGVAAVVRSATEDTSASASTAISTANGTAQGAAYGFPGGSKDGGAQSGGAAGGWSGGPAGDAVGGGTDGSSSGSTAGGVTSAVAADAEQEVGVVTIVSTLGYEQATSAGTGMALTSDGLVLTNNHVIEGATSIEVTVESTGATYTATVVGTAPDADVAVLQLEGASGLATVTIDDDGVAVGDAITAIGNAEGTGDLVAAVGVVTALDQTMTATTEGAGTETLDGLVELQADVVSGDSGGPVVDAEGEVVGITTAASSGSWVTVAYAIDIQDALAIAELIESGEGGTGITLGYPAFLGVQLASTTTGSGASAGTTSGATIAGVIDGTPAVTAGLAAGDVITSVGGVAVSSSDELSAALDGFQPGDEVALTWLSASTGATASATVTLVAGPAD